MNDICKRVLLCHLNYDEQLKEQLDFDVIIWGNEPNEKWSNGASDITVYSPTKFNMESQHDERAKSVSIVDLGQLSSKEPG